jgi:hypothetical protein
VLCKIQARISLAVAVRAEQQNRPVQPMTLLVLTWLTAITVSRPYVVSTD